MKILALLILCSAQSLAGSRLSARVTVQSDDDVVRIARFGGVVLDDARVDGRTVCRNAENGFVTVLGSTDAMAALRVAGYALTHEATVSEGAAGFSRPARDSIPYQFGWPRQIFNGISLYENSPTVADIDGNGQLDVSVTNAWGSYNPTVPPYLITWRRNGAYLVGYPVALEAGLLQSSAESGIAAAADIAGDEKLELVCGDENGYLYAFDYAGVRLTGFPRSFGSFVGVFPPALADVDGDGKAEIAVITHDWDSPYGNAQLHLMKVTTTGPEEMSGFPVALGIGARNSPAIGDLDGDGNYEIVVGTGGSGNPSQYARITAYTTAGQVVSGFPWVIGANSVGNSPTLYDLNNDGTLEILIRVKPDNDINGIYAIDHTGAIVSGFPLPVTYGNPGACVAVGDMTGDGMPEIAYGGVEAVDSGKVWVYSLEGSLLPGFPVRVYRTWVDGSVAIADVDGDGFGDVVCATNGVSGKPGVIHAFNQAGEEVSGFPLVPGDPLLNSFHCHPTVADIDGDGDTEIFAGRIDKYVYGWDTPGIFHAASAWTTFKGNAARTGGQLRSPFAVGVRGAPSVPLSIALGQNFPNPFNPSTRIPFVVASEGPVRIVVRDMLGRDVQTLVSEVMTPGSYERTFTASGVASGVYICTMESAGRTLSRRMLLLR